MKKRILVLLAQTALQLLFLALFMALHKTML